MTYFEQHARVDSDQDIEVVQGSGHHLVTGQEHGVLRVGAHVQHGAHLLEVGVEEVMDRPGMVGNSVSIIGLIVITNIIISPRKISQLSFLNIVLTIPVTSSTRITMVITIPVKSSITIVCNMIPKIANIVHKHNCPSVPDLSCGMSDTASQTVNWSEYSMFLIRWMAPLITPMSITSTRDLTLWSDVSR